MIKQIDIIDDLNDASKMAIEVELILNDNSRRWCLFFTPAGLSNCGDWIDGTKVRIHYGEKHIFTVSEISKEIIERTLSMIADNGELLECTLPIELKK